MPSQFAQDKPGCDCCGVTCESCDVITYFTISGLASGGACASGCEARNGTYVFRTIGTKSGCQWTALFAGNNCAGASDWYSGDPTSGCDNRWSILFTPITGGVTIDVFLSLAYVFQNVFTPGSRNYFAKYSADFADCASAVGATLPLVAVSNNNCNTSRPNTVADLCGIQAATVTLG